MISETSPAYDAPIFIYAARSKRIPIVVSPADRLSARRYADVYRSDSSLSLDRWINRLVGRLYPRWVINYEGQRILRIQPFMILVYEWLGMGSPRPWQWVGAWDEEVMVTGKAMYDFYLKEGVKAEHLLGCRRSKHDTMAQSIKINSSPQTVFYEESKMPKDSSMLLCALVQSHYLSGRTEAEFQDYHAMVEAFLSPLMKATSFNVVVSLHPSHDSREFRYIETRGGKDNSIGFSQTYSDV